MRRLTGLLKYALTHRKGLATYAELAAATAQRRTTVEQGLNWLVSRGIISLVDQEGDQICVTSCKSINAPGGAAHLWMEVQALLAETAAYRAHFKHADENTLLP